MTAMTLISVMTRIGMAEEAANVFLYDAAEVIKNEEMAPRINLAE